MTLARPSRCIAEVLADAERALAEAGSESPRLDAEVLFRHAAGGRAAGWDEARLIVESRAPADADVLARFEAALARRLAREPLAYVTGEREFWSRSFRVDRRVLVPRPETEDVVAAALRVATGLAPPLRVIDVGTGSGVIAVTLALELAARARGSRRSSPSTVPRVRSRSRERTPDGSRPAARPTHRSPGSAAT